MAKDKFTERARQSRRARVKTPANQTLRVRVYAVLSDAVERGARVGYHRAHKHTDTPGEGAICDAIVQAVMSEACEVFDFGDSE